MAGFHIDNDFGGGTCMYLLEIFNEYFDALDENRDNNTEESRWRLDLAKNNVHQELHRGLRIN